MRRTPYTLASAAVVVLLLLLGGGAGARIAGVSSAPAPCYLHAVQNGAEGYIQGTNQQCAAFLAALPGTATPTPTATRAATATGVPPTATKPPATLPPTATATAPLPTATATTAPPTATATVPAPTATATVVPPTPTPGGALIVGSGGYATIGAAVTAAPVGATIRVRAGTYPEQLEIAKALTLVAYGDGPVWLDGQCLRGDTLNITASDVTVRGLGFKMSRGFGVLVNNGAARTTIDGNAFQDWNCADGENYVSAIGVWYAGSGQQVTNNRLTLRVERATAAPSNGMYWKSNSTDRASGGGHTIAHNTIVGCWDGIGGAENFDPHGGFDGNTEVAFNDISGCADDGIEAEGGSTNVWIHDNTIREAGAGVALAGVHGGPITVERNTIVSSTVGLYGTMTCFKVGASLGGGPLIIKDNICRTGTGQTDGSGLGQGITQTNSNVAIMVVTGNRWSVDRYVYELTSIPPAGSSFDGNCLWTADTTRFIKWGGTRYFDLATFRAATGQEIHGTAGPCP